MRRNWASVLIGVVVLIALVALASWVWLFELQRRSVKRQEQLVFEVGRIRWTTSEPALLQSVHGLTRQDNSTMVENWCDRESLIYGASVSNDGYDRLRRFTPLRIPGIRQSKTSVLFCVLPNNGKVYLSELNFSFTRNVDATPVTVGVRSFMATLAFPEFRPRVADDGTIIYAAHVPLPDNPEMTRAFDLDLSCAARFHGCDGGRSVIRSACPDYERGALLARTRLPE